MTVEQILAMQPGLELDRAVHQTALNRPGRAPKYSTDPAVAVELIHQLPIGASRVSQHTEGFNAAKPFIGFTIERNRQLNAYYAHVVVTAATLPLALCKIALLFTVGPKERPRVGFVAPKIGSGLKAPELEPLPARKVPEPPKAPVGPAL